MFIDTHLDTLWAMQREKRKFHEASKVGHVDLKRARKANLLCGFFTGYPTENQYVTEDMVQRWLKMTEEPRNKLLRINNTKDFEELLNSYLSNQSRNRKIGAVLHFEGAAGIDSELNRLYIYYECGLRSMSLTWNEANRFATGQLQGETRGLTQEGKDLLDAMESLGIIIDVSHLNDKSFWEVISHTNKPIMASHSNLRELADHKRNLTIEMVQAVADTNGSIGVNLCNVFLSTDPNEARSSSAIQMYGKLIEVAGIEHVHSGADLDGAPFPSDIKDITDLPGLFERVQSEYNLSEDETDEIRWKNVVRLIYECWRK